MKIKNIFAFTLAEVLITLAIIGVVAALTIPQVINAYEKQATINGLQKFYSTLNNVVKTAEAENGPHYYWTYYTGNTTIDTSNFVDTYILPYISYTKSCGYNKKPVQECLFNAQYKTYTQPDRTTPISINAVTCVSGGNGVNGGSGGCNYIMMNDGSLLAMEVRAFGGTGNGTLADGGCIQFAVDINGPLKGPNSYGKDVFDCIYLFKSVNSLTSPSYICTLTDGGYCAGKIIYDGWQIKDDYPW